jgi:hypothetical protein
MRGPVSVRTGTIQFPVLYDTVLLRVPMPRHSVRQI